MGREEQQEEREVIGSIFPDEIIDVSDEEYRLIVRLEVSDRTNDGDEAPEQPTLLLKVHYPESYPDVAPDLDILAPATAVKHPQLDLQQDKAMLLATVQAAAEENLGMAMVFTLVSTLKETAEQLITDRRAATQAAKEKQAAKVEEEENEKFHGTTVTRETFLKWSAAFQSEMEEKRKAQEEKEAEERRKKGVKEEKKVTGKELWENGLVGKIDEDDEAALEKLDKLEISQQ